MPAKLTWIDHDSQARERSLRILALGREKESRDELGIGGIRDAIADRLFPGTSTIQTRLRYMLFVPWIYSDLEQRKVSVTRFAGEAKKAEINLVLPLLDAEDDNGVFGRRAGGDLKRLPSSIYWSGLEKWGIRLFQGSRDDYHQSIDSLYSKRGRRRESHDGEVLEDVSTLSWHSKLPKLPENFPAGIDFKLQNEEPGFLRERIMTSCPESLLAWLVRKPIPDASEFPWQHHQSAEFPHEIKALLGHARLFSNIVQGAALIYNLALSEHAKREQQVEDYKIEIHDWATNMEWQEIAHWPLDVFWSNVKGYGHSISDETVKFIERWVRIALDSKDKIGQSQEARDLIRKREIYLKKDARSRFVNKAALSQWSGRSGLKPLDYRWKTAKTFIEDLATGLGGANA